MIKKQAIGVFDSGIGGLSVLKQLIRFLPYEKYVYLGDTARVPYGNKSKETVKTYARQSGEFLLKKGVKTLVAACNTVSSVAMDAVVETAGDAPVIDMIKPAAGAALRQTVNGRIGVIGTRATVGSEAYSKAIYDFAGGSDEVKVFQKACPLFVPLVEEGMIQTPAARMIAEEYLEELKKENIDVLVLGCTHYPLLSRLLREILPNVSLIDSGEHASVSALRTLAEKNLLDEERSEFVMKPKIEFYATDLPEHFHEMAIRFLGFSIESPKIAELE